MQFNRKLLKLEKATIENFSRVTDSIDSAYSKLMKGIDSAARIILGKTTVRNKSKNYNSDEIKNLRQNKRAIKNELKFAQDNRSELIAQCKEIQCQIRDRILFEKTQKINIRFTKMLADNSNTTYWKTLKKITRCSTNECLTIKNEDGKREFHPENIKETKAKHYETLYKKVPSEHHPHHDLVKQDPIAFLADRENEDHWYNIPPTAKEIHEIIKGKKNGKATTDLKNEMMKRCDIAFTKILTPAIQTSFITGFIPSDWNFGLITSLWKGKGNRESLHNHHGITVSSSVGNILEEIIDKRMEKLIHFTQGQGGGVSGVSTCDHLFLVRAEMQIAVKRKQTLFLTFFDVKKAFDKADVDNMLHIAWKSGVRGNLWRLLRNMSYNLEASVKTRYGVTRNIKRENGGRQGSRLTGRLFSRQMDMLSEKFVTGEICPSLGTIENRDDPDIGCLEWVDDALTLTIGVENT